VYLRKHERTMRAVVGDTMRRITLVRNGRARHFSGFIVAHKHNIFPRTSPSALRRCFRISRIKLARVCDIAFSRTHRVALLSRTPRRTTAAKRISRARRNGRFRAKNRVPTETPTVARLGFYGF